MNEDIKDIVKSMNSFRSSINNVYNRIETVIEKQNDISGENQKNQALIVKEITKLSVIIRGRGQDLGLVGMTQEAMRKIEDLERKVERLQGKVGRLQTALIITTFFIVVMIVVGTGYLILVP